MPPRSEKMNRFIFGFQRRVWWPKCTPASRSSRMETTAMEILSVVDHRYAGSALAEPTETDGTPAFTNRRGVGLPEKISRFALDLLGLDVGMVAGRRRRARKSAVLRGRSTSRWS